MNHLPAIDLVKNSCWRGVFIAAWATLLASEQRRHHPTGGVGVFQRLGKKEELGGGGFKYVYVLGGGG